MNDRVRWTTLFVHAYCTTCDFDRRLESDWTPDRQNKLTRDAKGHAASGHEVHIERGQLEIVSV